MAYPHPLTRPPRYLSLLELRALGDLITLPVRLSALTLKKRQSAGNNQTVIVLPGFGAGDGVMFPLRHFLNRHGFNAIGWGLGVNKAGLDHHYDPTTLSWSCSPPKPYRGETGVLYLTDRMTERVQSLNATLGEKVLLVGWSLGGTIAREVARTCPDCVEKVVTLGSPINGGPKYTSAAPYLARRGVDLDWIEQEVERRKQAMPLTCPVTAIVSPTDGIVDLSASVDNRDTTVTYCHHDIPHMGMGIASSAFQLVLSALVAYCEEDV
ncbi:esterase/lipase family protein [Alteromonas sp. CYL-A6]|uniref:esterase/lipase family protein n=1 Tax=Alteromonas nitratireducens TaxID=3390813 RepID=UPI0034B0A6E0